MDHGAPRDAKASRLALLLRWQPARGPQVDPPKHSRSELATDGRATTRLRSRSYPPLEHEIYDPDIALVFGHREEDLIGTDSHVWADVYERIIEGNELGGTPAVDRQGPYTL